MATQPKQPQSAESADHTYYADANVLTAKIEQPIVEDFRSEASVKLPDEGGYDYKPAAAFRLKGIVSYESGYAQVAGHPNTKAAGGFTTLATAAVENLNILDVITADRIVGQISTQHPNYSEDEDAVPSVTFLGTRFDNLRIAGHKVEVERHLDILGPKPPRRKSYFDESRVLGEISDQYAAIKKAKNLPEWASEQYRWDRKGAQRNGSMKCSLVRGVNGAPGTSFGHVIDLPHFGKIFLGELTVERKPPQQPGDPETYIFHLTMVRTDLGCLAQGKIGVIVMDSNGGGKPGGK
jgi:hypothetical protein